VFFGADDYRRYLDRLGRHAADCGTRLLAYCLMTNRVHLLAVPESEASLARALGRTHAQYALARNRAGGRSGHLWQNRFFSCPMDEAHRLCAMRYVDSNPVRAGLVQAAWDSPWPSARAHAREGEADGVLYSEWVEAFGPWDHAEWREGLREGGSGAEWETVRRATRTGEPLGSREFVAELEHRAGRRLRVLARGRPGVNSPGLEENARQICLFAQ